MSTRPSPHRSRHVAAVTLASASLVVAAALGAIFCSTTRDAWTAAAATGPASPADGILLISGGCGTLLCLWLGLGMTLSALSSLPGAFGQVCEGLAGRVAPAALRKVVAFVLGTTLTAALVPGTAISAIAGISRKAPRPEVVATARQAEHKDSGDAVAAPGASFRLMSGPAGSSGVMEVMDAAPPPAWSLNLTERVGESRRPSGRHPVVHRSAPSRADGHGSGHRCRVAQMACRQPRRDRR